MQARASQHDQMTKLWIPLSQEDDWPPVGGENLWAAALGNSLYRLDSVPFFAQGMAVGDIVRATRDEKGEIQIQEIVESSGNCTIRLIVYAHGPYGSDRKRVLDLFERFGADGEGMEAYNLVALNVPASASFSEVKSLLREGCDKAWWDCEEGSITDVWEQIEPQVRGD
jgi:Domain of unknown function (DUF4265)